MARRRRGDLMSARGATIFLTWLFERLTMSDGLRVARISTRPPGRSGYNWAIKPLRPPSSSLTKSS